MKRLLSLILALVMVLSLPGLAFAADVGVQQIGGGEEEETEPVSLDDLKINQEVEIEGWGILTLTSFEFANRFDYFDKEFRTYACEYDSGNEADYALLRMDITNTTKKDKDYLTEVEVKVIYDDDYEFKGWCYQYDFDRSVNRVLHKDNQFVIEPLYQGHYLFGCTLPNAVVNGKKPLQMIITIDGNELIYNIRK